MNVLRVAILFALASPLIPASDDSLRDVPSELRRKLVEQINSDRAAAGLPAVEYSEELSRAADEHCREMLREDYMSHWNRAGWKPYMRYSRAGIRDFTAENVFSLRKTHMETALGQVWNEMLNAHRGFMAERPPNDGHRQAVLGRPHTHVGIGVSYHDRGMRLIELFAARYVELQPLPAQAQLKDRFIVSGQILNPANELFAISVFYEPLPKPMAVSELQLMGAYGLPDEELTERLALSAGFYADGSKGIIELSGRGRFQMPLRFWKGRAGAYTVAVWVRASGQREPFIGGMTSVFVYDSAASR
jgi:uncharacterized protein YkwD